MKVLFISRKFPPSVGGMELFAYDLSNALAAKIDLKLVKWGGRGRLKAVLVALPYLFVRSVWALLRGKIDIIHVHDGVLAPTGYLLSRLFRKPFTVVIHGLDATYQNPLFKSVVPVAVRRADAVFCISSAAAAEAKKLGVSEDKIQIIPLAVNDKLYGKADKTSLRQQLGLAPETPVILTVGRLVKRKGVAWFIDEVLPSLVKNYPQLVYVVVGEGSDQPAIEAAVNKHDLTKSVRLLGRTDDDLLEAAYNGADIFVMPNINIRGDMEGFGLVLLEAALCALPVIATDTGGIKDAIMDGQNGRLVPVEDATGFQAAISGFLDEPENAKQFGQHSREHTLENYQWRKLADRYVAKYRQLIKH